MKKNHQRVFFLASVLQRIQHLIKQGVPLFGHEFFFGVFFRLVLGYCNRIASYRKQNNGNRFFHSKGVCGEINENYPTLVYLQFKIRKSMIETDAKVEKAVRSEEHTSELQSLMRISYAVFCLKKKKNNKKT